MIFQNLSHFQSNIQNTLDLYYSEAAVESSRIPTKPAGPFP
jgi:hypothetical protein